jgi:hypothetical protein
MQSLQLQVSEDALPNLMSCRLAPSGVQLILCHFLICIDVSKCLLPTMSPRLKAVLASCCLLFFGLHSIAFASADRADWSIDYNSTSGDEVIWTIRGDVSHQLRDLRVASAADVILAIDSAIQDGDDFVAATIVATTDGDIFDHDSDWMGVHIGTNEDGSLELLIGDGPRYPLDKVRVLLSRRGDLQSVSAHGSGSVTVHDSVLGSDNSVSLVASGSGDIIVKTDDPLSFQSLELSSYDSGDVKIESTADIIVHGSVVLSAQASGEVEVQSSTLQAAAINVATHGSGDASLLAHSRLTAKTVSLEAAGSGDITLVSNHGECDNEKVLLVGSSDVTSADVACAYVKVLSAGSGDVVINAVDQLDMSVFSSGSVKYAGDRPAHVTYSSPSARSRPGKPIIRIEEPRPAKDPRGTEIHGGGGGVVVRSPHEKQRHAKDPRGVEIHGGDVDVRSPHAHIHIEADGDDDSDSVQIWDDDDDDRVGFLSLAQTPGPTKTLTGVGIVAAAVVVVGAVAMVVARRRTSGYETIPLTV